MSYQSMTTERHNAILNAPPEVAQAIIIALAVLQYGPAFAQMLRDIFSKPAEQIKLTDFDAIFQMARERDYDWYVKPTPGIVPEAPKQ